MSLLYRVLGSLGVSVLVACSPAGSNQNTQQSDPLQVDQWYLQGVNKPEDWSQLLEHFGLDSSTARPNEMAHLNLANVSETGQGVLVALVDDGMDLDHEDLAANTTYGNQSYLPESFHFNDSKHGTAVAGIIAARSTNGVGIRGVAPGAKLVAYNALRTPDMAVIADALTRQKERVAISNNSWGDFNSWGVPFPLNSIIEDALKLGVSQGRNGLGINYVFSAGNGSTDDTTPTDDVNLSGLVNNRYTIPVCAVDYEGTRSFYSEQGATLLVCAPSQGNSSSPAITTTDSTENLGYNTSSSANTTTRADYTNTNYTHRFNGTSAAAPMVSGVIALMLQANPRLSWRDVRVILAKSTKQNDSNHPDWTRNAAGYHINHAYGFGLVDAQAAVRLSKNWKNLPAETTVEISADQLIFAIPDHDVNGITIDIPIADNTVKFIEFIDVWVDSDHTRLGDLTITLISPSGTRSVLARGHTHEYQSFRYDNYRFGTMRHLGEPSRGTWHLHIQDGQVGETGKLNAWKVKFYGT
jgi:subtilisin-like proprotein convertase family protein